MINVLVTKGSIYSNNYEIFVGDTPLAVAFQIFVFGLDGDAICNVDATEEHGDTYEVYRSIKDYIKDLKALDNEHIQDVIDLLNSEIG